MPSTNVFNELCVKISLLRSIPKKIITECNAGNAVYFRLCIDLIHILPPVTAEGFDGSHHPRFAECFRAVNRVLFIAILSFFQTFFFQIISNFHVDIKIYVRFIIFWWIERVGLNK